MLLTSTAGQWLQYIQPMQPDVTMTLAGLAQSVERLTASASQDRTNTQVRKITEK